MTAEFFRLRRPFLTRHYRQHNVALKYFRMKCEDEGPPFRDHINLSNGTKHEIAEIIHPKGTQYQFSTDLGHWLWDWQDMISQMTDESIELVVRGPERRSRGIVSCAIVHTDMYDHKRHHAAKQEGQVIEGRLTEWHFVVTRDDGSEISVIPTYSSPKFEGKDRTAVADPGEIPRSCLMSLRFDATLVLERR
jgi:hypothetical protein